MGKSEGHVVLYRKYRSRNFDEVVGQDHIINPLKQSIASGRIAHAYLFTGPRGTGKTSIARIFANEINGFDYQSQLPIDIIEIDGASNRRIDEVRELKERIHVSPVQAKYKVYIIDEMHMLTKEAFNALLKTLEEPPEHAVFILATTEAHKLPATIISRTQRYGFRLVPADVIQKHLEFICKQEKIKFESDALATIAKMGQGSLRDAISLLDQVSSIGAITEESVASSLGIAEDKSIGKLVDSVKSATAKEIIAEMQELLLSGSSATQIAKQIIDYLRFSGDLTREWLELIDSLIDVSASMQPEIALEVALLKANLLLNPSAEKQIKPEPKARTRIETVKDDQIKQAPTVEAKPTASTRKHKLSSLDTKSWQKILDLVKVKKSSLYSVLRMAQPEYGDGILALSFKFDFHQKQIANSKNVVVEAASEVIGETVKVEALVDKTIKNEKSSTEVEPTLATAEAKSVLDAFGGGEVVNI